MLLSTAQAAPGSPVPVIYRVVSRIPLRVRTRVALPTVHPHVAVVHDTNVLSSTGNGKAKSCPLLTTWRVPSAVVILKLHKKPEYSDALLGSLEISKDAESGYFNMRSTAIKTSLVGATSTEAVSGPSNSELLSGNWEGFRSSAANMWGAGDIVNILACREDQMYVIGLIQHHSRKRRAAQRTEPFSIPCTSVVDKEGESISVETLFYAATKVFVTDVVVESNSAQLEQLQPAIVLSYGKLRDGRKYFVDHILLYSDGFSQFRFKQGSAGGVYCLSLNYPPEMRRSRDRVRVLVLTQPGVSTKEGIKEIIADLVKSSTRGITTQNADGEDMLLFTDVVAFVSDYHEVGHVLDVVGVNGSAPCNLCSFLRFQGPESVASRYAYTTDVHSADPCYARTVERTEALRAANMSDGDLNALGLSGNDEANRKASPFITFSQELKKALQTCRIPLTENNIPVVNPKFDSYQSMVVAPDHLLAGNAINILNLAFKSLPSTTRRKHVDALICLSLRTNNLLKESRIYNFSASNMYTTSISSTFCILLVASLVFTEVVKDLRCPQELSNSSKNALDGIVQNLNLFSELVSKTYWYPKLAVDGLAAVKAFNCENGTAHIAELEHSCIKYIRNINELCRRSTAARKELDKPNLHRLLELYKHSIPAMGHARHFSELVFECAHQPLKQAIANSNNHEPHIQGVEHKIRHYWKNRLSAALYSVDGTPENENQAASSIVNLICGQNKEVLNFVTSTPGQAQRALSLVRSDMMRMVLGVPSSTMDDRVVRTEWVLSSQVAAGWWHSTVSSIVADFVIESGSNPPLFFGLARRVKKQGEEHSSLRHHSRAHDTISPGTVVQALVHDDTAQVITVPSADDNLGLSANFHISYFAIEIFVGVHDEYHRTSSQPQMCFAAVRKFHLIEGGLGQVIDGSPLRLLQLTESVRRVGLVHACQSDPTSLCLTPGEENVTCTADVMSKSRFYCIARHNGYPPRMA